MNQEPVDEGRSVDNKEELDEFIVRWMALHFNQASETILADRSFETILDDKSELIQSLYAGLRRHLPWLPVEVNEWLQHLRLPENIELDKVKFDYPFDNFVESC